MTFLAHIPHILNIEREGEETGTLWLGTKYPILGSRGSPKKSMGRFEAKGTLVLADIADVDSVYRLIVELQGKATPTYPTPQTFSYGSAR